MKSRPIRVLVSAVVLIGAMVAVSSLPFTPNAAAAPSTYTFSTTADFNGAGTTALNVATTGDEVKLTPSYTFPFVWMPASGRGTIVKIDAATGAVAGEYWSSPAGMARNPSRTTVDKNGNVWATNRDEASGGKGSVVHIGLREAGQCADRNGNGTIETSTGLSDIKTWTNAGGVDSDGGVETAADECVIGFVRTSGTNARTVAVAADNTVWVGGVGNSKFDRITQSHTIVAGSTFTGPVPAYGGFIDASGILWSSSGPFWPYGIMRADVSTGVATTTTTVNLAYPAGSPEATPYGLALDLSGNVWASTWASDSKVYKIDSAGTVAGKFDAGDDLNRGVTVTADGDVWVVNSQDGDVTRLSNAGVLKATIGVGGTPTGASVDASGKVWVSVYAADNAVRIDPATNAIDLVVSLGAGARPYTYGDMTGSVLVGGPTSGSWTKVIDSGVAGETWSQVSWNAVLNGGGVSVAAASSEDGSTYGSAVTATNGGALGLTGRYLKVVVTLTRTLGTDPTPVLSDLTVETNRPPVADPGADRVVSEGDLVTLDGSGSSDPDLDALTYSWALQAGYTGPAVTLSSATAVAPTFTPTDDGAYTFELAVDDGNGGAASDQVQIVVGNVDPAISSFTVPPAPVPIGSPFTLSAPFADAGTGDTHTAKFLLDGLSWLGSVTEAGGAGTASATVIVTAPGVYTASVIVTDDDGGSVTRTAELPVVLYDPTAGFVTGGGWIESPAGAYPPEPALAGKATFGFVSKYLKGATRPTGDTEFVFHAPGLSFSSSSYEWLVVSGNRAQYKGTGTVTGIGALDGTYKFILTAVDGSTSGDLFRMKIFYEDFALYDNMIGQPDGAVLTTAIAGGSIVIHTPKR